MYLFHASSRVKPGKEAAFEADQKARSAGIMAAPGFVRRTILKDRDNPGRYFYTSVWRSLDDLEAFRASTTAKAWIATLPELDFADGPVDRVECEIILDESAPADSG